MQDLIQQLASELDKAPRHVENVVRLLDEGNTIPFIARYRKELHGAMDDTALRNLEERLQYLRSLAERREAVKRSIEEQGKLTEELSAAIDAARTLAEVEDLYRPYKQKRRTRATIAREKGLAPLAELLFAQGPDCPDPTAEAARYVDAEKGVETVEDALSGASDIIAETISDDAALRKTLRTLLEREGKLCSQAAVEAYQSRISGPLLDRIDLIVEVPAVQYEDLRRKDPAEASETIRQRVNAARDRQHQRFQQATVQCNARMSPAQTQLFCTLDDGCARLMKAAFQSMGLTARSYDRILRVARTIADLDGSAEIQPQHLAEAIQYRTSNLGA